MISKIYKISFILLFMLFTTVLYNFCFALTSTDIDNAVVDTFIYEYNSSNVTGKVFDLELLNIPEVNFNDFGLSDTTRYLYVFSSNNIYFYYMDNSSLEYIFAARHTTNNTFSFTKQPYIGAMNRLLYNTSTNTWEKSTTATSFPAIIGNKGNIDLYSFGTTIENINNNEVLPYYSFSLSNEDLTTNCDFRVSFKFAPESADFPSDNIGSRWSWFCRLLVEHSLTDWEDNYNIKVKLSVVNKSEPNGLYYDLYDSNGEEIQKKKHIKEEILTESINPGDFFLFFTDNLQDTFKFEYEIYNKSEELLLKKIYTFKFTKSGLTAFNSTGTIMSENVQDSTGQDIENSENSFDTNGYDNTATDNDYYDVSNLDNLASSASDTINLAKKCFEILPGFIWVMVGVFLSVCIALRILGR